MDINAKQIRNRILRMSYECGRSVHLGGSLSMAEILSVLYRDILRYKVSEPDWDDRDRFILSKGHCVLALYAALAEIGMISENEIATYMQDGSIFGSHPVMDLKHGIECSSGSLGQGVSLALGMAKAAKINNKDFNIYTLVGNGECNEGSVWETFMLSGQWKLDNFTIIIDNNKIQSDGESRDIIDLSNMKDRLSGFDLMVYEVDGHNETELKSAFEADFGGKTKVIICNTIKGKGISFMENNNEWHHNRLIQEKYEEAMKEIEGE
ncbi:MAG: transketolase [Lachnospiraceae bacterium]|nr:transketolase [Lachnospiraceae bacterium]